MATSPQALSRLQLKTIAQAAFSAQSLDTTRVKLGLSDQTATPTFLSGLVSAGPFLVIMPAQDEDSNSTEKLISFSVDCVLWYGVANWADQDFTAVEDIISGTNGIKTYMRVASNYSGTKPQHISKSERKTRSDTSPCVVTYTWTVSFIGAN